MAIRRRIFLINKPFQLRFTFYVCSWLIALSLVYPLIISNVFDYFMRYMALDPTGPSLASVEQTRNDFITLLVILQVILLSMTAMISIFMSHRIAGPLYKLNMFLRDNANGNIHPTINFRKYDYFKELVDSYNAMMKTIQARFHKKNVGIQVAIEKIEALAAKSPLEQRTDLQEIIHILKASQDLLHPQAAPQPAPQAQGQGAASHPNSPTPKS